MTSQHNLPAHPFIRHGLLTALIGLSSSSLCLGATIAWQPSVDMFQGSTVQTFIDTTLINQPNGNLDFAFSPTTTADAGGTTTLNGVAFANIDENSLATLMGMRGETIAWSPVPQTHATAFGDGGFSGDGDIFDVLRSSSYGATSITLSNLKIGREYQMQILTNDARTGRHSDFQAGFSDGTNTFAASATAGTAGFSSLSNRDPILLTGEDSGDYIIGTFIADATTQTFDIVGSNNGFASVNSGDRAHINGFVLTSIPEPSRAVLLALGGFALLARRQR